MIVTLFQDSAFYDWVETLDGTESELEYYLANSEIYTDYTLALECGVTLISDV